MNPRGPVINLCFHGVGEPARGLEPGEAPYWISAQRFERILDTVSRDPRVRLSFDDGNASDIEIALPALLRRGLDATFFVLAGRLDQPGSLSTADVRVLDQAGMRIGSHGMDHQPWRGAPDAVLRRELVDARRRLEDVLGAPVVEAALPLGRYDRRVLRRARDLGYEHLHSSDRRWTRSGAWLQPRWSVHHDDDAASVQRQVLTRAPWTRRTRTAAVGTVKRFR